MVPDSQNGQNGQNGQNNQNIAKSKEHVDLESNVSSIVSSNDFVIIDSAKLRKKIITEQIYPYYQNEISNNLTQIKIFSTSNSVVLNLTMIMMSLSTIVSFTAPQFPKITYISYIAGVCGVLAILCERFGHFYSSQASLCLQRVNLLLKSIGINDSIPDVMSIQSPDLVNTSNPEEHKTV